MQILEEALKAKIEGRDVDSDAVARKRRRLMARIRLVSVLTVIALLVVIASFGRDLIFPTQPQESEAARLLRLLEAGTITPEQAIQLASLLETGALGETQTASMEETPSGVDTMESRSADVQLAGVSEAVFDQTARETFREAFRALALHPNADVRLAAAQMSRDETRQAAMQSLWTYAQSNPDDPLREEIYLLCGSVGEANNDPLGQRALEAAVSISPRETDAWRMLSRSYRRVNRAPEAEATAEVSAAIEAENAGRTGEAEMRLQNALPSLTSPQLRAPVATELGEIALMRGDFNAASARFSEAYLSRERLARTQPNAVPAQVIDADAQRLVRALDRSGRTREACEQLRQAQEAHDVAAPDQEILDRCQRILAVPLRTRVELAPQLRVRREQTQVAPTP
jgi:hypothetical protein